jgi:hypothetical protein
MILNRLKNLNVEILEGQKAIQILPTLVIIEDEHSGQL